MTSNSIVRAIIGMAAIGVVLLASGIILAGVAATIVFRAVSMLFQW